MKKILFILGFILACLFSYGQAQTTIMKIDTVIVEEFRTTDDAGTPITSYRRLTKKEAKDYIEKIRLQNDYKIDQLQMTNTEIEILNDRLKNTKEQKQKLQEEIMDNKRRIDEYKTILNR